MAQEVSVERIIAAPADELWARVANIERMGDISPENLGGKWLGGATGPAVGAKFKGDNQNGKKKWSTTGTVVECEPGRAFAFDVTSGPVKVARWTYRFEPTDGGCKVTEIWTDDRGKLIVFAGKLVSGVADRAAHNRESMQSTLDRLAELCESGT
jgi:Polyketide cyclase / dehydrase and lipid transport